MSAETHIKNYIAEVEDAYKKALGAVDEFKAKYDALFAKVQQLSPEIREALGIGEQAVNEAEQKTEETDSKAATGSGSSNAKS